MNDPKRPFRKIYAIVENQLVFMRLENGHAVRASAPLGRLDLVPLCAVQPVSGELCHVGIVGSDSAIDYLTARSDEQGLVTGKDARDALSVRLGSGMLTAIEDGSANRILAIKDDTLALQDKPGHGKRLLANKDSNEISVFEDDFTNPLIGAFYLEQDGHRYYLYLGDDQMHLLRDPEEKPRLMLCGDYFKSKIQIGYSLCTADEVWHIASPGAAGPATAKRSPPPKHAGAALFQTVVNDGRIAFRTIGTDRPMVLKAQNLAGDRVPLLFAEQVAGLDPQIDGACAFFKFEPDRLVSDSHFWIANVGTGRVLTAGDSGNPQRATCADRAKRSPNQLWRDGNEALLSFDGRVLELPATLVMGTALQLSGDHAKRESHLRLDDKHLYHIEENRKYVITEDPRGHEPVLALRDNASTAQRWIRIPYQATPRYGVDRLPALRTGKISRSPTPLGKWGSRVLRTATSYWLNTPPSPIRINPGMSPTATCRATISRRSWWRTSKGVSCGYRPRMLKNTLMPSAIHC